MFILYQTCHTKKRKVSDAIKKGLSTFIESDLNEFENLINFHFYRTSIFYDMNQNERYGQALK